MSTKSTALICLWPIAIVGFGDAVQGTDAAYIAMCHFLFNSAEDFMAAFMPHAAVLQDDMPNYTDIEPVIQISEVLISE